MTSRRKLLTGLGAGVAAVTVASLSGVSIKSVRQAADSERFASAPAMATKAGEPPATKGRGGDIYPNVKLVNQYGQPLFFYDDMLRGKNVLVNFMPISEKLDSHEFDNLSQIAEKLGPRLDSEIFMYTISSDPEVDTPERLAEIAANTNLPKGWMLITGAVQSIDRIGRRLYRGHSLNHGSKPRINAHTQLVHYGNPDVGLWGALPVTSDPSYAAVRASWVKSQPLVAGLARRAGPRKLNGDYVSHSRINSELETRLV